MTSPPARAPTPLALRLLCRQPDARAPAPPFGLATFSDDPDAAVAVLLDVSPDDAERAQVDAAASQIPHADELPEGRLVVVLGARAQAGGFFSRLFAGSRAHIPVAVRATALLARGYRSLGADAEADLVWGEATRRPS
jgi:hypothetical protein